MTTTATLRAACDGYRPGTPGVVVGRHQGCLRFRPDERAAVAPWARRRRELIVPPQHVVTG